MYIRSMADNVSTLQLNRSMHLLYRKGQYCCMESTHHK